MRRGAIGQIEPDRVEDRRARLVRGWVRERTDSPLLPGKGPFQAARRGESAAARPLPSSAETPVLLCLSEQAPEELRRRVTLLAASGRRVYILATVGFGEGTRDPGLRELSRAHVLVRRVPDLPVSGELWGRGETGTLWVGPRDGDAPWAMELTGEQGAACFQVFLRLFWHHARDEAFTTGKPLDFRPARPRPFDVPLSGRGPVRLHAGAAALPEVAGGVVCAPEGVGAGTAVPSVLLTPPGSAQPGLLAAAVAAGSTVAWDDAARLPAFVLAPAGPRALALRSHGWTLHVDLDDGQARALSALVTAITAAPPWRFHADRPLGALAGHPVWLEGAAKAAVPMNEQALDAGSVRPAELRAVFGATPESWPPPHPLALAARWRWTVLPPRLPAGSAEDKLLAAWRSVDDAAKKRLGEVSNKLAAAGQRRESLAVRFASLAGALLGLSNRRRDLLAEVESLKEQPFSSCAPEGAKSRLRRLHDLEVGAEKLDADLRKTQRDEEIAEDARRQRAEWERTRGEKVAELERRGSESREAKAEHERLTAERSETEEAMRVQEGDKDLSARKKKLDDDVSRVHKRIQEAKGHMDALKEWLERPFKPRAPDAASPKVAVAKTAPGPRFVPSSAPDSEGIVPGEALPALGTLRTVKGQRYLVIGQWEELDKGEVEAGRLSARLVASEEAK